MELSKLKSIVEVLVFVSNEPIRLEQLEAVLPQVSREQILAALNELAGDYDARGSGLEVCEIAGGWRISTRPEYHEYLRSYLKKKPSARLSPAALETLAIIAYKQPITIPEILELRGVSSSSAIKTLLDKRLIVPKGRKECVGRPIMYGTSREFLIQFGLKDLSELPSIEEFEELVSS
ncbi:MAG: SMC-Scp complex subunit ScpB [Acidobacteriota bacterium]|nr:SMC-Scp complex subunit ScpB [Blastocatellia bacterium]MDW8412457.1 SMC-Scp complex subunit ScpB [Acidobacteriota bacterium]